jgi:signal peptidase I
VMLRYPMDPDKSFVKRMIAREGDTVHIVSGEVRVNGAIVPAPYVSGDHQSHDDWGPEVIPEGYCFVLGDNRRNSSDSRTFGFVPKKYIIARVQLRWWPLSAFTVY